MLNVATGFAVIGLAIAVGLALLLALPLLGIAVAALTARWTLLRALSTAL